MKTLRWALPVVMGLGWLLGAGCDDDRDVVDIGAGGDVAQPGGAGSGGGETTPGGAGAGGEFGVGGPFVGCPADISSAEGQDCLREGKICSDGNDDPCQFGQSIVCVGGKWQHQEAFPAPCGGAGGAETGGAGGAVSGGAAGQAGAGGQGGAGAGGVGGAP